ncbi:MAG: redoxin domain-containing protein [Actinomycetia bacterium]|nr:redoxin domain-containing protein [Actinomycetes bacterium]
MTGRAGPESVRAAALPGVGDRLDDVCLRRHDGSEVSLGELVDGPTIVPIVRYYGCMPCRDFLLALEEQRALAESRGISFIGVGKAADYQAEWLMNEAGVGYELLVDPDENLYRALGLGHFPWWKMLAPTTMRNYLRAVRRSRQGRITNHPLQAPGVIALDPELRLTLVHRGATLGDYPPAGQVVQSVSSL